MEISPFVFQLGQKCLVQMPPSLGTETSVSQEGTGKKKEGLIRDINKTLERGWFIVSFYRDVKK